MKVITTLMIFAILAINTAYADNKHHKHIVIEKDVPRETIIYTDTQGVASAISAAQCHFDAGSFDLQLCGGWGNSSSQNAYTVGGGQKFGDFLFNYTITEENGLISRGGGINWKIKFK
jgi:hypothetical protein